VLKKSNFDNLCNDMGSHSLLDFPRECCGIITTSFEYKPARNISTKPKNSFIIDPLDILKYENCIWGFYHSHPGSDDPIPSKQDLYSTVFSEYKFIVGFGTKFYIYWLDKDSLKFEEFNESHCKI
jgi:proteasome lid subunit RPN8/RPN11